jgi:O-antigen ligase/SAM-dependent methyltransferase
VSVQLGILLALCIASTAIALRWQGDVRVLSVFAMILAPAAAGVVLTAPAKPVVVAAVVFPLPALLVALVRHRGAGVDFGGLAGHPFLAFALLYAACAAYGLAWGLWRGNDVVLAAGQTFTGALFVAGFLLAGPVLAGLATARHWTWFVVAVALLSVPGLLPYAAWLEPGATATMVRFLEPTAFFAPICTLLALVVVAPRQRRAGLGLAGFFALVTVLTYTRSYWLGLATGALLLALVALAGRRLPALRLPRRPELRLAAVAAAALAALLAFTPVAPLALERGAQVRSGSADASVAVREHELRAALRQVRATPISGVGSGGQFTSLHHLDSSRVFLGPTNFVHNAYLYFPLKFGALGFAALFALLGGAVAMLVHTVRRVRAGGLSEGAFPAVAAGVLALSLTAPNLVDPSYSLFGGAMLFLAGLRPARPAAARAAEQPSAPVTPLRPSPAPAPAMAPVRPTLHPAAPYRTYVDVLGTLLTGVGSVLDVGCGSRSPLADVRGSFRSVGVDAHRPSIQASRRAQIHDDYLEQQVTELDAEPGSFDAVVLLDLIEHLERDDARALLERAERIARRRVVVSTPNGFVPQDGYGDNAWQVHRSGWTVADLEQRGYRVYGLNGPKWLRGGLARLHRPRLLTGPFSVLLQPFVLRRPRAAFQLVAVREAT